MRGRSISFPTLHVRKTGIGHRGHWKAGCGFPNVARQEPNQRGADGKIKDAKRETYRKAYANMKEEGLLKFLNNRNNSPEMRMMA